MRSIAFYLLFITYGISFAQVDNNAISRRIPLHLNEVVHSSTRLGDVEWDCINKSLTNKCLIYHNDQWFSISVRSSKNYYLNIFRQECQEKFGVQLLLIEGDPCETETYRIIACIPTTDYGDFHLALDSLEPDKEYLLNVDGYLGDQCDFDVELSTYAKGFPLHANFTNITTQRELQTDSVITIRWTLSDSLKASQGFEVFRRKNKGQTELIRSLGINRNALGESVEKYVMNDTIDKTGIYSYSVFSLSDSTLIPIKKEIVHFEKQTVLVRKMLEFFLPKTGQAFIYVFDELSGAPLEARNEFMHEGANRVLLDLSSHYKKGVNNFRVVIRSKGFEKVFSF